MNDYNYLPDPRPCGYRVGDTVHLTSDTEGRILWTVTRLYAPTEELPFWRLTILAANPSGETMKETVQEECLALFDPEFEEAASDA